MMSSSTQPQPTGPTLNPSQQPPPGASSKSQTPMLNQLLQSPLSAPRMTVANESLSVPQMTNGPARVPPHGQAMQVGEAGATNGGLKRSQPIYNSAYNNVKHQPQGSYYPSVLTNNDYSNSIKTAHGSGASPVHQDNVANGPNSLGNGSAFHHPSVTNLMKEGEPEIGKVPSPVPFTHQMRHSPVSPSPVMNPRGGLPNQMENHGRSPGPGMYVTMSRSPMPPPWRASAAPSIRVQTTMISSLVVQPSGPPGPPYNSVFGQQQQHSPQHRLVPSGPVVMTNGPSGGGGVSLPVSSASPTSMATIDSVQSVVNACGDGLLGGRQPTPVNGGGPPNFPPGGTGAPSSSGSNIGGFWQAGENSRDSMVSESSLSEATTGGRSEAGERQMNSGTPQQTSMPSAPSSRGSKHPNASRKDGGSHPSTPAGVLSPAGSTFEENVDNDASMNSPSWPPMSPRQQQQLQYQQAQMPSMGPPNALPQHPSMYSSPGGGPSGPPPPVATSTPQGPHHRSVPKDANLLEKLMGDVSLFPPHEYQQRLTFYQKLINYCEQNNQPITGTPTVSKKPVDLYKLYLAVKEKGGFEEVTKSKHWRELAVDVAHLQLTSQCSYQIRNHYRRYLLPFECHFDRGGISPLEVWSRVEQKRRPKEPPPTGLAPTPPQLQHQQQGAPGEGPSVPSPQHTPPKGSHGPPAQQQPQTQQQSRSGTIITTIPVGGVGGQGPPYTPQKQPQASSSLDGLIPPPSQSSGTVPPPSQPPPSNIMYPPPPPLGEPYPQAPPQGMPYGMEHGIPGGPPGAPQGYYQSSTGPPPRVIPTSQAPPQPNPGGTEIVTARDPFEDRRLMTSYGQPPPPSQMPIRYQQPQQQHQYQGGPPSRGPYPPYMTPSDWGRGQQPVYHQVPPQVSLPSTYISQQQLQASSSAMSAVPSSSADISNQSSQPQVAIPSYPGHSGTESLSSQQQQQPSAVSFSQGQQSQQQPQQQQQQPPHPQPSYYPYPQQPMMGPGPPRPPSNQDAQQMHMHAQLPDGSYIMRRMVGVPPPPQGHQQPPHQVYAQPPPKPSIAQQPMKAELTSNIPLANTQYNRSSIPGVYEGAAVLGRANGGPMIPVLKKESSVSSSIAALSAASAAAANVVFPPDSVEATPVTAQRRRKVTPRKLGGVDAWRICMALKSGLLAETTWALNVLTVLLYDDTTVGYFGLEHLPGLLELLIEYYEKCLDRLFAVEFCLKGDFDPGLPDSCHGMEASEGTSLSTSHHDAISPPSEAKLLQHNNNNHFKLSPGRKMPRCAAVSKKPIVFEKMRTKAPEGAEGMEEHTELPLRVRTPSPILLQRPCRKRRARSSSPLAGCDSSNHVGTSGKTTPDPPCDGVQEVKNCILLKKADSQLSHLLKQTEGKIVNNCHSKVLIKTELDETQCNTRTEAGGELGPPSAKAHKPLNATGSGVKFFYRQSAVKPGSHKADMSITQTDAVLNFVTEERSELMNHCHCVSNVLRGFSFIGGNDRIMSKKSKLIAILSKLLLLHHKHEVPPIRPVLSKPTSEAPVPTACSASDELANAKPVDLELDRPWWWASVNQLRDDSFVILCNISAQLDLGTLEPGWVAEDVCDAILHWATCSAAYAQDPLPPPEGGGCGSGGGLSPFRYSLEILTKLTVLEPNVDLLLATPPWERQENFIATLANYLSPLTENPTREFALVLLSTFATVNEIAAVVMANETPAIQQLILFLEMMDTKMHEVVQTQGMDVLRRNPELMGTSVGMLRRAANTLLVIAKIPDCRPKFARFQQKLLQFTMSTLMDSRAAATIAEVLFQLQRKPQDGKKKSSSMFAWL